MSFTREYYASPISALIALRGYDRRHREGHTAYWRDAAELRADIDMLIASFSDKLIAAADRIDAPVAAETETTP